MTDWHKDLETDAMLPKEDPSLNPITSPSSDSENNVLSIAGSLCIDSIQTIIWQILLISLDTICFICIGHTNDPVDQLGAYGFSLTLSVFACTGISTGIMIGFSIYSPQLIGGQRYQELGVLLQRTFVLITMAFGVSFLIIVILPGLLRELQFEEILIKGVWDILKWSLGFYYMYGIFITLCAYLVAVGEFYVNSITAAIGFGLQVLFGWLFIIHFDLGAMGIGLSKTIAIFGMLFATVIFIHVKNICPKAWISWTKEATDGLWEYTKQVFGHGMSFYLEWVMFECITLLIARLNDPLILAGHTIMFSLDYICFQIQMAFAMTASAKIGNIIGSGDYGYITKLAKAMISVAVILDILLVGSLYIFINSIGHLYTSDEEIVGMLKKIIAIYIFAIPCELANCLLGYLLRNLGHEHFYLISCVVVYFFVLLPAWFIVGYILEYSYQGIYMVMVACYFGLTMLLIGKLVTINWKEVVLKLKVEETEKGMEEESIYLSH